MLNKIHTLLRKLGLSKKQNKPKLEEKKIITPQLKVHCPFCNWEGDVEESLKKDCENDTCPTCGETALQYEIKGL